MFASVRSTPVLLAIDIVPFILAGICWLGLIGWAFWKVYVKDDSGPLESEGRGQDSAGL
jgi:hypothetical protein